MDYMDFDVRRPKKGRLTFKLTDSLTHSLTRSLARKFHPDFYIFVSRDM